jgi:TrwC relaxase
LGLRGEAAVEGFRRMFHGRDPTSGKLLGRPHGERGLPAWDLVFRPVKDVSVLHAIGTDAEHRAARAAR